MSYTRISTIITFAIASIVLGGCASPPKANPRKEVSWLNTSIQEGYSKQYEVLANDDFERAEKYNKEAQKSLNKGESSEKFLDKVAFGRGSLERIQYLGF